MSNYSEDLPTIKEELGRKSLETLESLMVKENHGEITVSELKTGLNALFGAVSGLVGEEFLELITAASIELEGRDKPSVERRIFQSQTSCRIVCIDRVVGSGEVRVIVFEEGEEKRVATHVVKHAYSDEIHPDEIAKKKVDELAKKLLDKKYLEI